MKKRMRIQKFDKNLAIIDDRMVVQDPEFIAGPKETYDGPIRIEFSLFDDNDIQKCIDYMQKLKGKIPIAKKSARGRKSTSKELNSNEREEFLVALQTTPFKDIRDFTRALRKEGFRFLDEDFMILLDLHKRVPKKLREKKPHQAMMLQLKEAKDPKADKYDPQLIFLVDILERKSKYVYVVMYGKLYTKIKVSPNKEFKQARLDRKTFIKFPHWMREDEREKYRRESRAIELDPAKKKSKFYLRWEPDVIQLNPDTNK